MVKTRNGAGPTGGDGNDDPTLSDKVDDALEEELLGGDDDGASIKTNPSSVSTEPVSGVFMEAVSDAPKEKTPEVASTSAASAADQTMIPMAQIQNMFQTFLQNMFTQSMTAPSAPISFNLDEQQKYAKWDREYPTPNFVIRQWSDSEKLSGPKNFKSWKNAILLDLRALNLAPFIESEKAAEIPLSPSKRSTLDAQALQLLRATVAKNLQNRLQKIESAYAAFRFLTEMFDGLEAHYLVKLHNRFHNLRYRPGFDPIRFVNEFDDYMEEYVIHGTTFSPKYTLTLFLQKIDGIYDPTSPYYTFYNMICQDENQDFNHVKEKFLAVDNSKIKGVKRKNENKENVQPSKSSGSYENKKPRTGPAQSSSFSPVKKVTDKYTVDQLKRLKTMSKEEKKKIQCSKCGEYFHSADECKNPGRMCYCCHKYGHEKKDCPKLTAK